MPKPTRTIRKSPGKGRRADSARTRASSIPWLVTSQPHAKLGLLPTQSSSSSSSSSCFPAGTRVTMADGSEKRIERIAVGDRVVGLSGPVEVYALETPILGGRTYLRMAHGSLYWSAEHLFWVQREGEQYFGSHDKAEYEHEQAMGVLVGLTRRPVWSLERAAESYAHVSGWKRQRVVVVPAPTDLQLYYVRTRGCHTVLVNGYVVSGGVDDTDFDYGPVQWNGLAPLLAARRAA